MPMIFVAPGDRPAGGSNDGQPVAPTLIQNAITRGGSNQTAAFDERKVSVYGTTMRAVFDNQGERPTILWSAHIERL